jgi:hypothetical protein
VPSKIVQRVPTELPVSSFKYTPLQHVRTIYASFIQGLFQSQPPGSGFHWSESFEETEIVITDENPIQLDRIGMRPAITFTRGPVQSFSIGIDDMLSYNQNTGVKTKSLLIPSTMSINCCSRSDLESEQIAWVIAESIWLHREMFMQQGFFEVGRNFVVGSPSPPGSIVQGDSADEWSVTTVQSPFQFHRTARITPLNVQVLKNIGVRFNIEAQKLQDEQGAPTYPAGHHNPPYEEEETYPLLSGPSNQDGLRRIPDPLNPARTIVVRPARPRQRY